MNTTPLKNLEWFSFTTDLDELSHLSIFQAIIYILLNEAVSRDDNILSTLTADYVKLISDLEGDSAEDIYLNYDQANDESYIEHSDTGQDKKVTVVKDIDPDEICIPDIDIEEELTLLNHNRIMFTDFMGAPISTLYSLLQLEIDNHGTNKKSELKTIKKRIGGVENVYFTRKSLKNWKSIATIKRLGLFDIDSSHTRNLRDDYKDKLKLTTGMLMYLLENLQHSDDDGNKVDFRFKGSRNNLSMKKIYDYFANNYLDRSRSNFPEQRVVTRNLDDAYKLFNEEVKCARQSSINPQDIVIKS